MSQRNRGSEITAQVIVDGDLKGGSWAKVLEWTITPRQNVEETGFNGELEDDLDFSHHGYDMDMSFQEIDGQLRDVLFLLVAREKARGLYPDIQIMLTFKHRAGQDASETLVMTGVKFKFDSISGASKKDFINTKISGKFKDLSRL
jgi:hypothetical protein